MGLEAGDGFMKVNSQHNIQLSRSCVRGDILYEKLEHKHACFKTPQEYPCALRTIFGVSLCVLFVYY